MQTERIFSSDNYHAVVTDLQELSGRETVTIGELLSAVSEGGMGFIILLFAIPNCLPLGIPWMSTVLSIPILIVSVHMMWASRRLHFPRFISEKHISGKNLNRVMIKMNSVFSYISRYSKPRMEWMFSGAIERILGIFVFTVTVVLALPIPLMNFIPGLVLALVGIAMIQRDGLIVLLALLISLSIPLLTGGLVHQLMERLG